MLMKKETIEEGETAKDESHKVIEYLRKHLPDIFKAKKDELNDDDYNC